MSQWETETFNYDKLHKRHLLIFEAIREVETRGKLLELGCGVGVFRQFLIRQMPEIEYFGMDISASAIESINSKNVMRVNFNTEEFENIVGDYNSVVASGLLEYVSDVPNFLDKVRLFLTKNQGYFCFSYFNDRHFKRRVQRLIGTDPHRHPEWKKLYSFSELRNLLEHHGFDLLREHGVTAGLGASPAISDIAVNDQSMGIGSVRAPDVFLHQKVFLARARGN